jgi:hypothetical protein
MHPTFIPTSTTTDEDLDLVIIPFTPLIPVSPNHDHGAAP